MPELTITHALLDTENLFRCFRTRGAPIHREIGRLWRHFPTVIPEISVSLGALAAYDFADWLEIHYNPVLRRSFGKPHDPGVLATRAALNDRDFTLTEVPPGRDKAELAVKAAAEELVARLTCGHMTFGGEDHILLDYAASVRSNNGGTWQFCVIMPDSKTKQMPKFSEGGAYEGITATALDCILNERRQQRRQASDQRLVQRRLIARLMGRAAESGQDKPLRFLAAIKAICASVHLPLVSASLNQWWLSTVTQRLASAGLDEVIAQALVSWVGEFHDPSIQDGETAIREHLFLAAFEVCLGSMPTETVAEAARTYVAPNFPSVLNALERAIERGLSSGVYQPSPASSSALQ
jgi:hypothetical protein